MYMHVPVWFVCLSATWENVMLQPHHSNAGRSQKAAQRDRIEWPPPDGPDQKSTIPILPPGYIQVIYIYKSYILCYVYKLYLNHTNQYRLLIDVVCVYVVMCM